MARGLARGPEALLASLAWLTVLVAAARAQVVEPGICPFSTPLADWDAEQFVSEPWYEIKALAFPGLHDSTPRPGCTRWHFARSDDGQGLHARLAYRSKDGENVVRAFAQYTTSEKHPRFNLTFHDLGALGASRSVDMKLVATDYRDFALLWGCSEPNLFDRKVVTWVLSRQPVLSESAQDALRTLFRRHDIRAERLVPTDHATCGGDGDSLGPVDATVFGEVLDQADSVFASYRDPAGVTTAQTGNDADPNADVQTLDELLRQRDQHEADGVSWSYVGSYWSLGEASAVAALLGLAAVSLLASLLTFRALTRRLQRPAKPVLPVHRQDVIVATLGSSSSVDYSRFGGLGQGLSRKHVSEPAA